MSFQYHPEAMFNTGVSKLFCKGPNSKHFRMCGPVISVANTRLCHDGAQGATVSEWGNATVFQYQLYENKHQTRFDPQPVVCQLCPNMFTRGLFDFLDE